MQWEEMQLGADIADGVFLVAGTSQYIGEKSQIGPSFSSSSSL